MWLRIPAPSWAVQSHLKLQLQEGLCRYYFGVQSHTQLKINQAKNWVASPTSHHWAANTLLGEGKHSFHQATSTVLAELRTLYPLSNKLWTCWATSTRSMGLQALYWLSYSQHTPQSTLDRITLGKWRTEKKGARNSQLDKEGMVDFLQDCLLILHMLFLLQADDFRDAHNLQGIVPPACLLLHQVHAAKGSGPWGRQCSQLSLPWIRESIHIWGMETMST